MLFSDSRISHIIVCADWLPDDNKKTPDSSEEWDNKVHLYCLIVFLSAGMR